MATEKLSINSSVPNFALPGIDENIYDLKSLIDEYKGVVIVFSCNHCPYVKAYEDRLISIQNDYSKSIKVIAINSNDSEGYPEDSFENMKVRALEKGFNFLYLRDSDQEVAKSFGATHTPEVFLVNSYGKLVFHGKIDDNWQDESGVKENYLRNALDELVDGKEITINETYTIGCTIKWKS